MYWCEREEDAVSAICLQLIYILLILFCHLLFIFIFPYFPHFLAFLFLFYPCSLIFDLMFVCVFSYLISHYPSFLILFCSSSLSCYYIIFYHYLLHYLHYSFLFFSKEGNILLFSSTWGIKKAFHQNGRKLYFNLKIVCMCMCMCVYLCVYVCVRLCIYRIQLFMIPNHCFSSCCCGSATSCAKVLISGLFTGDNLEKYVYQSSSLIVLKNGGEEKTMAALKSNERLRCRELYFTPSGNLLSLSHVRHAASTLSPRRHHAWRHCQHAVTLTIELRRHRPDRQQTPFLWRLIKLFFYRSYCVFFRFTGIV